MNSSVTYVKEVSDLMLDFHILNPSGSTWIRGKYHNWFLIILLKKPTCCVVSAEESFSWGKTISVHLSTKCSHTLLHTHTHTQMCTKYHKSRWEQSGSIERQWVWLMSLLNAHSVPPSFPPSLLFCSLFLFSPTVCWLLFFFSSSPFSSLFFSPFASWRHAKHSQTQHAHTHTCRQ